MRLSDIMTREVEVLNPDDTLEKAAQKMRDLGIGSLPVCDGKRLLGVVSDRDIAVRAIAEGKDPKTTRSADCCSSPVLFCYADQEVSDAAQLMHDRQVRRLVVLDRDNKQMVGIVALGDIATNSAEKVSGEALQGISKPPGSTKPI